MMTPLIVVFLGICLFICIVNYSYQKFKYKNAPIEEIEKLNAFNSPTAWLTYSVILGIAIGIIVCISFIDMVIAFSSIGSSDTTNTTQMINESTN